jgi:hypothetical protein
MVPNEGWKDRIAQAQTETTCWAKHDSAVPPLLPELEHPRPQIKAVGPRTNHVVRAACIPVLSRR